MLVPFFETINSYFRIVKDAVKNDVFPLTPSTGLDKYNLIEIDIEEENKAIFNSLEALTLIFEHNDEKDVKELNTKYASHIRNLSRGIKVVFDDEKKELNRLRGGAIKAPCSMRYRK